jgi:hypothetical protein
MIFAKIINIRKIHLSITHFGLTLYTEKSAKPQQQEGFAWKRESKGKKARAQLWLMLSKVNCIIL